MAEKLSFFSLIVGLPIGLVFSLFAATIVLLFGAGYSATAPILSVLIWYAVTAMVVNVFAQALYVQNRQRYLVVVRVGGLLLKLALSLFLLPRIGVIGAALATSGAEIVVLVVLARDFRFDLGLLLPRLLRLMIVAGVTLAAMALLGSLHPLIGMIGGALVYAIGVLVGHVLASDDWDLLYRLAAAVPGGSLILRYWRRDVKLNW